MSIKVENIAVKLLKTDDDNVSYAIKADVTNNQDDETEIFLELQGVDVDGFGILEIFLEGNIPFGQTKTLTKREDYCDKNDFHSVMRWQPVK